MNKFFESEGFKVRLAVSIGMVVVFVPAYFFLDEVVLKILIAVGLGLALVEIGNVAAESRFFPSVSDLILTSLLIMEVALSLIFVVDISRETLGTAIVACTATDVGAYLFGNLLGGRILKSRPFPKISPNKTWEGSVLGIIVGAIVIYFWTGRSFNYLWMAPAAFIGDILESKFKRQFGVKDSNDFLLESESLLVRFVEGLLGGSKGHGGYFDRLDSLALVLSILFLIKVITY